MLIAQITDSHIVEKNCHCLSEPATQTPERLLKVVHYLNALNPSPDIVLFTGDLCDAGTAGAYQHFKELVQTLKIPLYVIPGNHDHRETMRSAFAHHAYLSPQGYLHYAIDDYPLRLIGLDTLVEGEIYGRICDERFTWLKNTLALEPKKPTLLFMHHPLIKTGVSLVDKNPCFVPEKFEAWLTMQTQVIGIVAGHYHHLCLGTFGGKANLLAPSIAPAWHFAHPDDSFITSIELDDPSVTLHRWHCDLTFSSHVMRVKDHYPRLKWKDSKKDSKNHHESENI